jgi:hypothetical protein
MIITGKNNIENVRRLTIIHALRLKERTGMWPNGVAAKLTLPAVRTYGWTGRTAKSALAFMDALGFLPNENEESEQ